MEGVTQVIKTNGIGQKCDTHLNLSVTLEAQWAAEKDRRDKFTTNLPGRR